MPIVEHHSEICYLSINSEVELQEGNCSVMIVEPSLQDIENGLIEFDLSVFREFVKDPNLSIISTNPLTGKPDYTCPRCFKVYTHVSTLFRHLKFECGQQPKFSCPHCSYKSRRKDNIKSHVIAKHEKGKKIKCLYCEKTFVHKFRLTEHIRLLHAEENISSLPIEMIPFYPSMELSPSQNTSFEHNLHIDKHPCTSTPKKMRTSEQNTVTTVELPTVITVPSEFPSQQTNSSTTIIPINNTAGLPTDLPEIKEETTLEITDTVETAPAPAPDYTDVLRVIF